MRFLLRKSLQTAHIGHCQGIITKGLVELLIKPLLKAKDGEYSKGIQNNLEIVIFVEKFETMYNEMGVLLRS